MSDQAEIEIPEGFVLRDHPAGFHVTYSWWHPIGFVGIGGGLLLSGAATAWSYLTRSIGHPAVHVFTGLFFLAAVIAAYAGALRLLEKTEVDVDGARLKVRHGPLPFPGGLELDLAAVESLEVRQQKTHSGNAGSSGHGGSSLSFDILALLKDSTERKVVGGFAAEPAARWLLARIEKARSL